MQRALVATASVAFLALTATPSLAAITPTPGQILAKCPDIAKAVECPARAGDFLAPRPKSAESDAQIIDLVLKIAEAAQDRRVTMPVCLNAADGLRVLAGGVQDGARARQIQDIADALCKGVRTAAIGTPAVLLADNGNDNGNGNDGDNGGGPGVTPPAGPPGDGDVTPPDNGGGTPPADNDGDDDGGNDDNGGGTPPAEPSHDNNGSPPHQNSGQGHGQGYDNGIGNGSDGGTPGNAKPNDEDPAKVPPGHANAPGVPPGQVKKGDEGNGNGND